MKPATLSKLGLAASLVLICSSTVGGARASIFGRPAAEPTAEVEMTPEIQAASARVEQTKANLDQARRQLDAAKASLKAADAEYRAAQADKEALCLRKQAEKLADGVVAPGNAPSSGASASMPMASRLTPTDRIDANSTGKSGAPVPSAAQTDSLYQGQPTDIDAAAQTAASTAVSGQ
jgi:multidrug efflux pump subunit AcrA (membrane-fusion protein)